MNISACKGCKVLKVTHDVVYHRNRSDELREICRIWHNQPDAIQRGSEQCRALNPLLFTQRWVCNNCGYVSLRNENGVQFHPIEPHGKDLDAKIPATIRKDFNEARLIAELSPRCANVLLRTCLEGLCNWIAEEFLDGEKKAKYPKEKLNRKIDYIKAHTTFVSDNPFVHKMMEIIKEYGNEIHPIKKIDDSDTFESFKAMLLFIELICDKILLELKERETVNEYHPKISQKSTT